jgi:hypothetical protein
MGASANFHRDECLKVFRVRIDSYIDDDHFDSKLSAENVDGRAAGKEVQDHLARNRFGIRAYAFLGNAVVRSKRKDDLTRAVRKFLFADGHKSGRDLFQSAEASEGFRETVEARERSFVPVGIEDRNGSNGFPYDFFGGGGFTRR